MLKKGQVSVFVIVGIILIIVTAFLFFNSKFDILVDSDTRMKNQVSDIVKECISDYASTGTFLLGFQGGRIDLGRDITIDPRRYIDFGFKIANWDSQNGDVPTIASMETELDDYILSGSYACITTNLAALEDSMDINISDRFVIESEINNENVVITASLPIRFNEKNSPEVLSVEDYYVKLDSVRLGDLYDLAIEIYNLEESTDFVEDLVLDQIYSASDYTSTTSMPSEGMLLSCGKRIWTIPQLKENLANLNNNNFKYLHFEGTYPLAQSKMDANLNEDLGTEDLKAYYESHYTFSLDNSKRSFSNYGVEVMMPSTEVTGEGGIFQRYPYREFEVTPSSGNIVKSMDFKVDFGAKMPIPCIQIFHHLYNLDYDLIVKLTDYSDDGNKYTFQFPLRVRIQNNNPKDLPAAPLINQDKLTATNEEYCRSDDVVDKVTTRMNVNGEIVEEEKDYVQESSMKYPARVFVKDHNGEYLTDVNISYRCMALSCDMGQTSKPTYMGYIRNDAIPYLETNFPFCVNGELIATKTGFHDAKLRIDTTSELLDRENLISYDLELKPVKTFDINIDNILIVPKELQTSRRIFDENDGYVFITIENEVLDFESSAIWPNEEGFLDSLTFVDEIGIPYNLSVIYADKDYNLKGIMEIEGWTPDVKSGNKIEFIIPASTKAIDQDNYVEFENYMKLALSTGNYGVFFR